MKKTLYIKLLLITSLLNISSLYAEDIWVDNFADQTDKGYWGNTSNIAGVIDWSLNVQNCTLTDENDYIKVVSTSGGRLQAKDIDGEAIWKTISIDIADFSAVSILINVAETGSSTSTSKYVRCYYKLDEGPELPFETNAENSGNWGNVNASHNGLSGSNLQVIVRLNNPNAGDVVYIKDLQISGTPIVPENDRLTTLIPSEISLDKIAISTKVNQASLALPVFRFKIDETTEAMDNLPTKISEMTFYNSYPEKGINWETYIGGILLFKEDIEVIPNRIQWNADSVWMEFLEGQIDIPNAASREFELRLYLNTENPIIDAENFQLNCKENAIGFTTFDSGSGFSIQNPSFASAIHLIDVRASRIRFIKGQNTFIRNHHFSIVLKAVDEFDNLDLDTEEELILSLHSGFGNLEATNLLNEQFVKGELAFDSLHYSEVDTIKLSAKASGLGEWISDAIIFENTKQTYLKTDTTFTTTKLISSLRIKEEDAFEAYRFALVDSGRDHLPTILKKINLKASVNNQVNWKKSISKFIVKRNNRVLDITCDINNSDVMIQFADQEVGAEIENEQTADYSVFCYLKKGKTIDGETFQITIDSLHPNWLISDRGSGLCPIFDKNLLGPEFTLNVEGEQMNFTNHPDLISFQEVFEMGIQLTDRFGNVDLDFNPEIRLSLATGNGELLSENLASFRQDGNYLWSDLVYSLAEIFTIQAECDHFPSILSGIISAVDRNSTIQSSQPIASLNLDPLVIDQQEAIDIFTFNITDLGTHDQLSTILSNLKFHNSFPENSFKWKKHIAGAVLKFSDEIVASTNDIEEDYIRFSSTHGLLEVANGLTNNFSLGIFFRKGNLPDQGTIQVEIPSVNHEWETLANSSALSDELPEKQSSSIHKIEVLASKYVFLNAPLAITDSQEKFSLKVGACDAHNNIDLAATGNIELQLETGNGDLVLDEELKNIENGIVLFDSLQYTGNDKFTIALAGNLESEEVLLFVGEDELAIVDNFELANLNLWQNTDSWSASSYQAINGNYSLKHNLVADFGSSHISIPLADLRPNSGLIQWSFVIRNGDWDPSGANRFLFHLLMDHTDPESSTEKFSIGVNLQGARDLLSFWSTDKDDKHSLLLESAFNWNENESVAIKVKYYPEGRWELAYNRMGELENWLSMGSVYSEVAKKSAEWFSALDFYFESSSRAGALWFDDLAIKAINTAPFLKSYELIGSDSIKLVYSEKLDFEKSLHQENFIIKRNGQAFSSFSVSEGSENNELIVKFSEALVTGEYSVDILNVSDVKGAVRNRDFFQYSYFAPAMANDVVINEIMADENPAVALPAYEFIELYNRLNYPVSVKDWRLQIDNKEMQLDSAEIAPKSYLILGAKAAVEDFEGYGSVLGVAGFSGLSNSGATIQIVSAEGILIDVVDYSSSWYQNTEKESGGWSLERIDPNNFAWQKNNWSSSVHQDGGTPGKLNSIDSVNVDLEAPLVLACNLFKEDCIQLLFSEPMDTFSTKDITNYQLSGAIPIYRVEQKDFRALEFYLFISNELVVNQQYKLSLSDKIKDLGGNSLEIKQYSFWVADEVAAGDVVINEVLFNPYPNGSDYVEIINVSEKIIDLKDLKLGTRDDNFQLIDTLSFSEKILHPNDYLLITEDTLNVRMNYFTSYSDVFCQAELLPAFNDKSGRVVINSKNSIIDDFEYNEEMHFALLTSFNGVALERLSPFGETNAASNWQSAAQNIGFGTPGLQNSVYREIDNLSEDCSLSSKVFSPDNDGIDDKLTINFNLKEDGYLVSVIIFNSLGIEIRKLATNVNLANKDALLWDGLFADKTRAPIGVYLVYIELFNLEGEKRSYKIPCVLGGKFN